MRAFWSNGKKIALPCKRDGNEEAFMMNADGTRQTKLSPKNDTRPDRQPIKRR